jgi:hypothetical protein
MFEDQTEAFESNSVPPKPDRRCSWERCLQKAMRESDPAQLLKLVYAAEEALLLRWKELSHDSNHGGERKAMKAAANELLAIKIHRLGWPAFWV